MAKKMNGLRSWLSLLALAALGGCTTPITPEQANAAAPALGAGSAQITIIRDAGLFGSACSLHVAVDGLDIGVINPGQKLEYRAAPGDHEVKASQSDFCGGGIQYYTAHLAPGSNSFVSAGAAMGQSIVLRHDKDAPL